MRLDLVRLEHCFAKSRYTGSSTVVTGSASQHSVSGNINCLRNMFKLVGYSPILAAILGLASN